MSDPIERVLLEKFGETSEALGATGAKLDAIDGKLDDFIAEVRRAHEKHAEGHADHNKRIDSLEKWKFRASATLSSLLFAFEGVRWWLTHRGE